MTQAFSYPSPNAENAPDTVAVDHTPVTEPTASQPFASPANPEPAFLQIQNRLLNLATQIDHIQNQLEELVTDTRASSEHVMALTHYLTDPQSLQTVHERMAELAAHLVDNQEQVIALTQAIQQTADRAQVERLAQTVADREQLERIAQSLAGAANQEQMERLLQSVAHREQVASLEEALKKLNRTQFKTNTLGESKEQQVSSALATLQTIAINREKVQENLNARATQQMTQTRAEARAELAAELLPALDSLEMALESGTTLLDHQQARANDIAHTQSSYLTDLAAYLTTVEQRQTAITTPPGFWQRMFGSPPEPQPQAPLPPPRPVDVDQLQTVFDDTHQSLHAWLQGLALVRDRFTALLHSEGIQRIDALQQPFDPRLHVAVEAETRDDVTPDTVVRVLRQGYRQRNRVLRYAEVVVARADTTASGK